MLLDCKARKRLLLHRVVIIKTSTVIGNSQIHFIGHYLLELTPQQACRMPEQFSFFCCNYLFQTLPSPPLQEHSKNSKRHFNKNHWPLESSAVPLLLCPCAALILRWSLNSLMSNTPKCLCFQRWSEKHRLHLILFSRA